MRGLRLFCLIAGIVNIIAGLLAWPLGLGNFAATRWMIVENYKALIADGKIKERADDGDYLHFAGELVGDLEIRMSSHSAFLIALFVGQGIILITASLISRKSTNATMQ